MTEHTPHRLADVIVIRSLAPHDHDAWRHRYRQYAVFYDAPMDDAILDRTWSWLMQPAHPVEGIVAVLENGDLAGLAHYRAVPDPLLGQDAGFLDDLFVAATHRNQGIGHRLIAAVASIARARAWPLLRWITAHDNAQARRLYDAIAQETPWVTYELNPVGRESPVPDTR